ncbi:MAG: alpha/beta hydrolase [Chloroflexi bacterium]|nr:MAG: alpha/beta hydrolase [Chloroflexota bacterium]
MSAIIVQQHLTHYEVIGRGQPVLFLHSWLGSWRTWMPTMEMIADRYRAIAPDFWGFGDSASRGQPAHIDDYVDQIVGFVDALGMLPPHLVGHGLGGVVAIRAASVQPERFGKVLVTGTPVLGPLLQTVVKPSGLGRLLQRSSGNDLWIKLVRQVSNGDAAYNEVVEDIAATDPTILQHVLDDMITIDLLPDIARLAQPLLAIYGGRDRVLTAEHGQQITETHGTFRQVLTLEKSGHFPFLDQPTQFNRALLEFLGGSAGAIELKELWKRRVSQREFL